MLTCTSYEEMGVLASNHEREAIMDQLKECGKDKKYLDYYDHEEFEEAMQLEAKEIGLAEVILQKAKEDAINLYKNGASRELIIKSLNITEEQLDEYLEEA